MTVQHLDKSFVPSQEAYSRRFLLCIYSVDTETQAAALVSSMSGRSGVEAVPIMLGGGHYYFRNTPRGQGVLQRMADIMVEAEENPEALYWKFAGQGNIVGDEPAASMAVVEMGIRLPEPSPMAPCPPVGCFMAPWQRWVEGADLKDHGRYRCEWAHTEVEPEVIHFAGGGKQDPMYRAWRQAVRMRRDDRETPGALPLPPRADKLRCESAT